MKKAKKKGDTKGTMSPARYMKERVRNLPIGKCYINPDWEEEGMAHIIVTRNRAGGNIVYASFLVDTLCLGVTSAEYAIDFTPDELERALEHFRKNHPLEEIDYNTVHNLIYGAIEFAEEGGIKPVWEFKGAGLILEEDTDDIPLIEFNYGKDGEHYLIIGEDGKEQKYLKTLHDHLGNNFYYSDLREKYEEEEYSDALKNFYEEKDRYELEEYSYQHPEYPIELKVKNQFIADAFLSPANRDELPRDVIKQILLLPEDEAAEDISNIILYSIGKTYKGIEDDSIEDIDDGSLLHSAIMLTQLQSSKGLPALLEILRQSDEFIDFHFYDIAADFIPMALCATAGDDLSQIESFLYEEGLESYNKTMASEALIIAARLNPEQREEVIEIYRRLITSMKERLPQNKGCDAEFAGFVASHLIDLEAKELIPEIKELFSTNYVDQSIAGNCDEVIEEIEHNRHPRKYEMPTAYEQYEYLKSLAK